MDYGYMIYALRSRRGMTQHELSLRAKVGLSQPQISQLERGANSLNDAGKRNIERVLALGQPRKGEDQPHYALAALNAERRMALLFGTKGELGIYRDRRAALLAKRMLGFAGLEAQAAPLWAEYAARKALDVDGDGRGVLSLIDRDEAPQEVISAACEHALSLLAKARADEDIAEEKSAPEGREQAVHELVETLLTAAGR